MMFVATLLISRLVPLLLLFSACLIAGRWLYDRYRVDRPLVARIVFAGVLTLGLLGATPYALRSAALVRGEYSMSMGDWEGVSRSFDYARRLGEGFGERLRSDWVRAEMNQQKFAAAEAILLAGMGSEDDMAVTTPDALYQLAISRYYLDRLVESRRIFEALPDASLFFLRPYFLGRIAERTGDADAALAHYQRCLDLQPDLFAGRYQLVRQLLARGEAGAAAAVLAAEPNPRALAANPHYQTLAAALAEGGTSVPPVEFILVQTVS